MPFFAPSNFCQRQSRRRRASPVRASPVPALVRALAGAFAGRSSTRLRLAAAGSGGSAGAFAFFLPSAASTEGGARPTRSATAAGFFAVAFLPAVSGSLSAPRANPERWSSAPPVERNVTSSLNGCAKRALVHADHSEHRTASQPLDSARSTVRSAEAPPETPTAVRTSVEPRSSFWVMEPPAGRETPQNRWVIVWLRRRRRRQRGARAPRHSHHTPDAAGVKDRGVNPAIAKAPQICVCCLWALRASSHGRLPAVVSNCRWRVGTIRDSA